MNRKYKKDLPKTTYKKQLLKVIWSSIILILVFTAKKIDTKPSQEFINVVEKIINYDLKWNDKRIIKMKEAITAFSISTMPEEYSAPMQGTLYKKYNESKTGIDIVAYKESVESMGSGEVIDIKQENDNHHVVIRHGKLKAVYGNMKKVNVKKGQRVSKGHLIGSMGDISKKNKHFHFEIWKNESRVDPLEYIQINDRTPISYQ